MKKIINPKTKISACLYRRFSWFVDGAESTWTRKVNFIFAEMSVCAKNFYKKPLQAYMLSGENTHSVIEIECAKITSLKHCEHICEQCIGSTDYILIKLCRLQSNLEYSSMMKIW